MRLLFPLIFLTAPVLAGSEKKAPVGVEVSLVSENASIAPGGIFKVGFKIHHLKGFHTYWKNPGIAGVATNLVWQLPEGFSAGPIQWPYPEKTLMAGHPVHGYERDVMLVVDIKAPAQIRDSTVTLKANATWMACADGCFPGSTELEMALPIANPSVTDPAVAVAFAKANEEIPALLKNWTVELLSAKDAKAITIRLKPELKSAPSVGDFYFFSTDGQVSSDKPQRVETGGDGSVEISVARSEQSPKGRETLPGILQSSAPLDASGRHFAVIEPAFRKKP